VLTKPITRPNFNAPAGGGEEESDVANGKLPPGYGGVAGK
jgi:hypothetical protein